MEWGYNRNKEPLPQIIICMLMAETSRLSIDQVIDSGSLKDVTTLETTLSNMDAMLNCVHPIRFVIAVPVISQFAKRMVTSE